MKSSKTSRRQRQQARDRVIGRSFALMLAFVFLISGGMVAYTVIADTWPAYVDTGDPGQALLVAGYRWPRIAIFAGGALVLLGVGLWLFIGSFIADARMKREHRREIDLPDQPWLWRREWSGETIASEDRDELWTIGLFAVVWNLLCIPLLFLLYRELAAGRTGILLALLFPLMGLGAAGLWFRRWRRQRRFGGLRLRLQTLPGRVGGTLQGTLEMNRPVPAGTEFQVSLTCVRRKLNQRGRSDERFEELLWEDRRLVPTAQVGIGRTSAPIGFEIPPNLPPADGLDSSDQIIWLLNVRALSLDPRRVIRFSVPVFADDAESPAADGASLPALSILPVRPQREPGQDQELARQGIQRFDPGNGGIGFEFPAGRSKAIAIMLVLALMAMAGVGWALMVRDSPLLAIIFIAVVALVTVYSLLLVLFESRRIQAWPGRLLLQRRFLGRLRERDFGLGDFDHLELVQELQTDNLTWFQLRVVPHEGRQIVAATGIEGMTVAQRLVDAIDEVLTS